MADLTSTNKDATQEEWKEQLEFIVECHGYNPNFIPDSWLTAYEDGVEVVNFFYDEYIINWRIFNKLHK